MSRGSHPAGSHGPEEHKVRRRKLVSEYSSRGGVRGEVTEDTAEHERKRGTQTGYVRNKKGTRTGCSFHIKTKKQHDVLTLVQGKAGGTVHTTAPLRSGCLLATGQSAFEGNEFSLVLCKGSRES